MRTSRTEAPAAGLVGGGLGGRAVGTARGEREVRERCTAHSVEERAFDGAAEWQDEVHAFADGRRDRVELVGRIIGMLDAHAQVTARQHVDRERAVGSDDRVPAFAGAGDHFELCGADRETERVGERGVGDLEHEVFGVVTCGLRRGQLDGLAHFDMTVRARA